MPHSLLEDLKSEIARPRAILVIGAGVSIQATGNQPCASWKGLLHDGARQCAELDASLRGTWLERVNGEIDSGDLDDMLSAAEKITSKLGGRAGGE